jgi:hypothetical protein
MERDIKSVPGNVLNPSAAGQVGQAGEAHRAMCFADLPLALAQQSPDAIAIIAPGRHSVIWQ